MEEEMEDEVTNAKFGTTLPEEDPDIKLKEK